MDHVDDRVHHISAIHDTAKWTTTRPYSSSYWTAIRIYTLTISFYHMYGSVDCKYKESITREIVNMIKGNKSDPVISHLLFEDDSLFFCKRRKKSAKQFCKS